MSAPDRFASDAARRLAAERGVDAASISGTGKGGRITVGDVKQAAPADASNPRPDPPAGLGEAGRELWASILRGMPDAWELDEREEAILAAAARQADDVARCEAIVARDGPEALGSAGQPVASPYMLEARQGRLAVARLLGQLDLPAGADAAPSTSEATQRGRKAAKARWGRRDRVNARRREVAERRSHDG